MIVIGAGGGGAVVAKELAERGLARERAARLGPAMLQSQAFLAALAWAGGDPAEGRARLEEVQADARALGSRVDYSTPEPWVLAQVS